MKHFACVCGMLLSLSGCGTPPPPEPPDPEIVAVFEGGEVSALEIDQRILGLPPAARRQRVGNLPGWYEELARQIAAEALLRREAEERGTTEDPELMAAWEDARRQFEIQVCHQKLPQISFETVSEDDLRREYEQRREEMVSPEQRRAFHLFLRYADGESRESLTARLVELRDRALNGENFPRLATEHSQSETRHREGLLGQVTRGQLAPELEEVIFGLTEGVPSDPVLHAEGGHIFFVDNAFVRRDLAFDEVRDRLAAQLRAQRRRQAIQSWEDALNLPEDSFVPTQDELRALLRQDDGQALVLRIGDFELTLSELRGRMKKVRRSRDAPRRGNLAGQVLKTEERQALVLYHCRDQHLIADQGLETALATWTDQALVPFHRSRRLGEWIDGDPERLRSFFDANPGRFSSAPQWQLRRLVVPVTEDAATVMERLERARAELDAGELSLEELAAETHGEIEDLGWRTLNGVRRVSPRAAAFVSRLLAGQHAPPFRSRGTLTMLHAVARKEPEPRPFEEVGEQVRRAYVEQHGQDLDEEMIEEMLTRAGFRVFPEHLAAVRAIGSEQNEDDELIDLLDLLEGDS